MLDIKFIRENPELVQKAALQKKVDLNIDEFLDLDVQRRSLLQAVEDLNKKRKEAALAKNIEEGKALKLELEEVENRYNEVNIKYEKILFSIPNIPSEDTPVGQDESENLVLRKVGEPAQFDFKPKEHWELGEDLGVIDMQRAAKVSGSRFVYLKGPVALLEYALMNFALSILTNEEKLKEIAGQAGIDVDPKPFVPVNLPVLIRPDAFHRMARLEPKEERYYLPEDDLYLVGSAEHTMGAMHMDETFPEQNFPIRYVAFSPAFRRESGTYGKDMKGMLRIHQFDKLEVESFTLPENGRVEQDFIIAIQEYLMNALGLPYQVVSICTGDMGGPDYRQIDIETWMPGQNKYRETHTSDYNTDYQSRRLNTKVKLKDGKSEFVHMNDATVFSGRPIIAIMENYQQADGSIKIPEVLQPYMFGIKEIKK
jgi:seryl-tRNA synthetase